MEPFCVAIDPERVFKPINIAVLTVSDTRVPETDTSGDILVQRIRVPLGRMAVRPVRDLVRTRRQP